MSAMFLERLFHPDASLDVSQHSIICFFQPWQDFSNLRQLLLGNNYDPFLCFIKHSKIARSHDYTVDFDRNVDSPWLCLERRPDS